MVRRMYAIPLGNCRRAHELRTEGKMMLVLRRKIGERIVIDGRIEVTVLSVRGGKVRLGVAAPRIVRVLRQEVLRPAEIPSDPTAATVEVATTA
jgi:carbon storage regulator